MPQPDLIFTDVAEVRIQRRRWDITIHLRWADGRVDSYVASSDRYYTDHSGIYFDSLAEYRAAQP